MNGKAFTLTVAFLLSLAVSVHAEMLTIDNDVCHILVKHNPDADISFQSGVDVHGNKVAPADIEGNPTIKTDSFSIKLTADMAQRFGIQQKQFVGYESQPNQMIGGELLIGNISVEKGRVLFNGQPLTPKGEEDMIAICDKQNSPDQGGRNNR